MKNFLQQLQHWDLDFEKLSHNFIFFALLFWLLCNQAVIVVGQYITGKYEGKILAFLFLFFDLSVFVFHFFV